ncbi:hypothetical protein SI65_06641 [Aspergillus cristatus]|uniref:Uncharacterized protein n=1 Tax=Aspergillus cristatus TaxID=573508 RepID=A0A1E3BA36_ASPCR|nr:hypothetical protein SI65_06641 [Aspergillus cristatus]
MPAGPMDALGAFSYLSDNLPTWITRVTDLTAHTAAKNAEYAEAYKKHATTAGKPRRRRKNSSVCSIRTEELFPSTQIPNAPTPSNVADQNQNPATNDSTCALNESTENSRKRGTDHDDAPSFEDPTASLVSTRHNLIIHYDGHTQKVLEDIVRNIATARNNIRRGRMAQLPRMGFRAGMPSIPGRGPPDAVLSSIRSARNRGLPGPQKETSAFDLADKQLEVAHGLCESAACQFLRSGDCKSELSSVNEKFKLLLNISGVEVRRLKEEQERAPPEPEKEETAIEPQLPTSIPAIEPSEKLKPASPNEAATGAIEVDDDTSASMEPIDLRAFRANRMARMRRAPA